MKLIFEKSVPGRRAVRTNASDVPTSININKKFLRKSAAKLPELSELDVVRHFTELSRQNFGVETNFYPLGSCTMKYNPKVSERIAGYPGFIYLQNLSVFCMNHDRERRLQYCSAKTVFALM